MSGYWLGKKFSKKHIQNLSKSHAGKRLGPYSQEYRDAISVSKVGFLRTPEEKKQARIENQRRSNRKIKEKVFDRYGRQCANKDCRWQNKDGSFGCTDIRILQLDHVQGGGVRARAGLSGTNFYRLVLREPVDKRKYQPLCPNCNWIKRVENREQANV